MKTILPAEIFIINKLEETQPNSNKLPTPKQVEEWMIEFAKMHVTEALNKASEKAKTYDIHNESCGDLECKVTLISRASILKAYSLDNVV